MGVQGVAGGGRGRCLRFGPPKKAFFFKKKNRVANPRPLPSEGFACHPRFVMSHVGRSQEKSVEHTTCKGTGLTSMAADVESSRKDRKVADGRAAPPSTSW